jgi:hypothetical protein
MVGTLDEYTSTPRILLVEVEGVRCPRCRSKLMTEGEHVWCTFVGRRSGSSVVPACTFGFDRPVALAAEES